MAVSIFSFQAYASSKCSEINRCVNNFESSSNSQKALVDAFCEAKTKVPEYFNNDAASVKYTSKEADCKNSCEYKNVVWKVNFQGLKELATKIMHPTPPVTNQNPIQKIKNPEIDASCIESSLKRDIGNGYLCASEKAKPVAITMGGEGGTCISDKVSNYYQEVVSDGINCLNSIGGQVDAKVIVQKMNNESGFNPQLSSPAGIGIGQLVPISIRELLGKDQGEGNGSWIVEKIAESKATVCSRFNKIVKQDLKQTPPLPNLTKKQNLCPYLSFDGGFQRNVILSLALFAHYRDQIVNELKKKSISVDSLEPTINKLTLAAYSRHGPAGVRAFLRSMPNGKIISETAVKRHFAYIGEVEQKMAELNCIRKFGSDCQSASFRNSKKWSQEEMSGEACIK